MKKSILFILLIGMTLLNSCETQEIVLTEQNNSNPIYNSVISSYLTSLKSSVSDNKENNKKISALMDAIDYSSVKQYDLKNTIELVVIDLKNFTPFNEVDQTKIIFFVLNNSIIRSNIVTFKNKLPFENPDQVIVSIFDKKEIKDNYSGKIEFYNLFQNILLSNEFENGKLTVNGVARIDARKSLTAKCRAWYWVTSYSDGSQTADYMFTTCDCEEQTYRTECGGGGGGGGTSTTSSSAGQPNYPQNPKDKDLFTYIDWDGEIVTKQFNEEIGIWELLSISLPDLVIQNNPEKYSFLIFAWPQDLQKIQNNNFIYTYDGASGSWEGEPATDETVAQAIEDQIDDSKLDPCLKAIMNQLKNTTNTDIALILKKLGANSIYEVNMVMKPADTYAETQKMDKYNYEIRVDRDRYTNATTLFKATALIHEVIHAYFLSIVDDYNYSTSSTIASFPELFQAFVSKNYPGGDNKYVFAQHNQMANLYVGVIASALQQYDNNYSIPYQVYEDMAWGSLQEAPIFDSKFPPGSLERLRIFNRYASESRDAQTGNQYPIGKKCN